MLLMQRMLLKGLALDSDSPPFAAGVEGVFL
jgi:hypothetical protein